MNEKLNTQDIIMLLADKHGGDITRADAFVKEFFRLIEEGLERDKYVKIKGLGTFKLIEVESRESVNVNSGERIEIKGHSKISFTPESALKEIINRPFSHFESVVLNDHVVFDDVPSEEEDRNSSEEMNKSEEEPKEKELKLEETAREDVDAEPDRKQEVFPSDEKELLLPAQEPKTNLQTDTVSASDTSLSSEARINPAKQRNTSYYFLWFIMLVMFVCLGSILAMYWKDIRFSSATYAVADEQKLLPVVAEDSMAAHSVNDTMLLAKDTMPLVKDTMPLAKDTMLLVKEQEQMATRVPKVVKKEKVDKPFTPDSTGYDIIGTETSHTIKEGETLTRVALRFYGTKALWPYIVKHNRDIIVNPDNVPFGTTIKIPKLKKKQ